MLNDLIHPSDRLPKRNKLAEARKYLRDRKLSILYDKAAIDVHSPTVFTPEAVAQLACANEERRK
jgi:hypothetical protein